MSFLSYIFPQTVYRGSTLYNRDIRVLEEQGKYKLLVNGSRQSGEYIKKLWQHAFTQFHLYPSPDVKKILVLGVAGGTVIHILHAMYPDAHISGVDIDSEMIAIGKKYFQLHTIKNLRLTAENAQTYVQKTKQQWDMIVIDLFVGASIPPFVSEPIFLNTTRKILSPRGSLLVNYLQEFEYEKLSDLLFVKLEKVFTTAKDTKIFNNRFFFCANQ